jgi:hypothetical protein
MSQSRLSEETAPTQYRNHLNWSFKVQVFEINCSAASMIIQA